MYNIVRPYFRSSFHFFVVSAAKNLNLAFQKAAPKKNIIFA